MAFTSFAIATTPAVAAEWTGRASVVDGDTIDLDGAPARIRLFGIDTPESGQTCEDAAGKRFLCGVRAAEALAGLIGRNGRVTCVARDRDRWRWAMGGRLRTALGMAGCEAQTVAYEYASSEGLASRAFIPAERGGSTSRP